MPGLQWHTSEIMYIENPVRKRKVKYKCSQVWYTKPFRVDSSKSNPSAAVMQPVEIFIKLNLRKLTMRKIFQAKCYDNEHKVEQNWFWKCIKAYPGNHLISSYFWLWLYPAKLRYNCIKSFKGTAEQQKLGFGKDK